MDFEMAFILCTEDTIKYRIGMHMMLVNAIKYDTGVYKPLEHGFLRCRRPEHLHHASTKVQTFECRVFMHTPFKQVSRPHFQSHRHQLRHHRLDLSGLAA